LGKNIQKKEQDCDNSINCTFDSIPTCKKVFNNFNKIAKMHGGDNQLLNKIDPISKLKIAGSIDYPQDSFESIQDIHSLQFTNPNDYLNQIKNHIPNEIISTDNYGEIQELAEYFNNNITSFFGFETNLIDNISKSDYLFAVSSKNGEREELLNILQNNSFSERINHTHSWRNIKKFTEQWSEPNTIINENVLGLWFEFDTSKSFSSLPVPNIFFQIEKLRLDAEEKKKYWISRKAIPMLTGKKLSKQVEMKLIESVEKLPQGTSVVHFGLMLSRENTGIRIVVNRIKPSDVIPYLHSIGWNHEKKELAHILNEIAKYSSRIILHLNINDKVDKKIGIECSFSYDKYHMETKWEKFLNFLERNDLCTTEKKEALLNFVGVEFNHSSAIFNPNEYQPSVMIHKNSKSTALVRYLSHIKIVYDPNKPLVAKAYPGVRLLRSVY